MPATKPWPRAASTCSWPRPSCRREPTSDDYTRLLDALAIRGDFETLLIDGAATYPSGPQITTELVTSELAAAVTPGRLTYQETQLGTVPALAVGTRVREGGPAAYFFYPQERSTGHPANASAGCSWEREWHWRCSG